VCAFIDAEHALDPEYARKIGVKLNELLISQPDTGEQALEIVEPGAQWQNRHHSHRLGCGAHPEGRDRGRHGPKPRRQAGAPHEPSLRKLTAITAKIKTVVIFINQIRMQIGVMFGNPETTPGGKALKFYTSVRLDIRRIAQIKKGEEVVGGRTA
jgi:recombination protein RecA